MFKSCAAIVAWLSCCVTQAADWPTWRADAARSANTGDSIGRDLHLNWELHLPTLKPAWPESQSKLQFDAGYEPVSAGGLVLVASSVTDSVSAFDLQTGSPSWQFVTNGPVRFAPAISGQRVYLTSDDGCLCCLELATGKQIWKFDGAPRNSRIIGNERLISMWPARSGVVVQNGVACFSTGIWPSMGIFIYAVDADTGREIWTNSTTGSRYITHPHGADSFGSISPQGYLAISGDNLIVPGGRTLPGVFDLGTGELRNFQFGGKGIGGYEVVAAGPFYAVANEAVQTSDGTVLGRIPADVVRGDKVIGGDSTNLVLTATDGKVTKKEVLDRKGKKVIEVKFEPKSVQKIALKGPSDIQLLAGDSLVAIDKKKIAIYEFKADAKSLSPVWQKELSSEIHRVIVADEHLIAVTKDFRLHTFSTKKREPTIHALATNRPNPVINLLPMRVPPEVLSKAEQLGGHAIFLGATSASTIWQSLANTSLNVTFIDKNADQIRQLRELFSTPRRSDGRPDKNHVSGIIADPFDAGLPAYLATLIVTENVPANLGEQQLRALFQSLRPYGGTWCVAGNEDFADLCKRTLPDAKITQVSGWTLVERPGALAGAGVWTHQYGDASNSVVSQDSRVRAPFGLLWFGGPSNDRVLPRHGHGPSPQVAGGRLFIEGADMLRCVDVYNGRVWWERDLPGLGEYYDNTSHQSGAGEIGSNYVSLEDHVYVIHRGQLLELDARTGKTTKEFSHNSSRLAELAWGSLAVDGDFLIATSSPVVLPPDPVVEKKDDKTKSVENSPKPEPAKPTAAPPVRSFEASEFGSASRVLHVFNRLTGESRWSRQSDSSFRHNAICAANGIVYCIDGISPEQFATLKRRGLPSASTPRLLALDAATGREVWSTDEDVFGTFLNYSREHGVLVQAGSAYRDRAKDEVGKGMIVYRGDNGAVVWKDLDMKYDGPCLLWHDQIITNGAGGFGVELLTGNATGWKYQRMYGCNTAVGSEHVLTFRSGAAGFYDLTTDSGTGNLGGFRSSCTSNLVPADGVLNAPDFTRTCSCSYQLQTSLAFVHSPETEQWTFGSADSNNTSKSIGYNLGAPGDRRDDSGVLWFDFPSVGGPSPKFTIQTTPAKPKTFARHSLLMNSDPLNWVGASGLNGITKLQIPLTDTNAKKRYTVRLVFSEPESQAAGERVFSVSLNGKSVLKNFDIAANSTHPNETLVREFKDVSINSQLSIVLEPSTKSQPVLSGVSIVEQEL